MWTPSIGLVRTKCHTNLRRAKNYHSLLPDNAYFDPEYTKKHYPIHLDQDEILISVYENMFGEVVFENIPPKIISDNIVITDQGLHLCSQTESEKIYFKDIINVDGPENKIDDLIIHIRLKYSTVDLPILYTYGENGRVKDVFLFSMFLGGVIGDRDKSIHVL